MIVKTRFTLPEDRMPDEDAIPSPFGLPLFRGCPDEMEIWEFGSTPITEPRPQFIPRFYGTQHF